MPETNPPIYRSRFENSFVKYTWMDADDGARGYWIAEYPDGRVGYFGADSEGNIVPSARTGSEQGTFRYHLVDMVDLFGHRMRYSYGLYNGVPLIEHIGYVYTNPLQPRYSVSFEYERREDDTGFDYLSDAKGGWNEIIEHRLARLNVYSGTDRIRTYELDYQPYGESNSFTRLANVQQHGIDGEPYPVAFTFDYSSSRIGGCEGDRCASPYMMDLGSLGLSLAAGRSTLVDINGDALPDVVDSSLNDGRHRFFLNTPTPEGTTYFEEQPVVSQVSASNHAFDSRYVQVFDLNGDGFTDVANVQAGEVLLNTGSGDWQGAMASIETSDSMVEDLADLNEDDEQSAVRFMDYNGDKKIDVIRGTQAGWLVYENTGEGFVINDTVAWPTPEGSSQPVGFEEDGLQISDMNGDGLLDLVQLQPGQLIFWLNHGWGQWSRPYTLGLPFTHADDITLAQLEDLNGDALNDVVVVRGDVVKVALNLSGRAFAPIAEFNASNVEGSLPERDDQTSVLFADMNGNGSTDVVWINNTNGTVRALEPFPIRPNQLSRIENGIGAITEIVYGTSVQHLARDTGTDKAWTLKLPHPMLVVDRTDTYDTLTNVHEITEYMYHDGFYDGVEKQFRGFAMTEIRQLGDTTQEEGLTELLFDVGATDPYRNGLQLEQTTFSYPHNAPPTSNTEKMAHALMRSTSTYEDCAIAEVPTPTEMDAAGQLPARWLCHTANVDVEMEKAPQSEWVRKESFTHYDGYGNTIRTENLGVVSIGDGACQPCTQDPDTFGAPCGNTCMGDEHYTETDYIVPGELTDGRWLLGQPYRERTFGREGSEWVTETLIYYDGPDFEGLPLGQLTHGNVSRTTQKVAVGSDDVINAVRNRYDEHGNVVETLDPNGDPAEHRHRRRYGYDADNLLVTQTEILLKDPEGHPYTLRRDVQYSPQWDKPIESTAWMLIHNGQEPDAAARRATYYEYDNFGRLSGKRLPGALHELSEVYHYELANPSSRIRIQKRSTLGGPLDLEVARCMDGKGRTYQTRTRLAEGSWQVDGLKVFNVRGSEWRVYQPYLDTHAACETLLPDDVRYTDYRRDGQYRLLEMIEPDAELYGGQPSVSRTVYAPLMTMAWDPEDSDPDSPHFETPTIQTTNGLGQLVAIDRTLEAQDNRDNTLITFTYDQR
ncbi:MAG: toxin TcdB middle/N-terminal domain-containing protein, partial [Myxococcota bacterium]